MAKPYRRKKGGRHIGNFRVSIEGKDINLETKDGNEAHRRARLAAKGKWPVIDAASDAAAAVLDPAADQGGDVAPEAAAAPAAPPPVDTGTADVPAPDAAGAHAEEAPEGTLADAAAAAADEATAPERDAAKAEVAAESQARVDGELAGIMAELTGGAAIGGDLLDAVCDGAASGLLWAERMGIELGWKWALSARTKKYLVTAQPDEKDLGRKCLRVGLKGLAVVHFPDLSTKLTPGVAIALGLVIGAGGAVTGGKLVDVKDPTKVQTFAEAQAERAAAAGQPPAPASA